MFLILLSIMIFSSVMAEEDVPSLCDDPYIHSADRLANNTYRVYRGNHYWVLFGLPDRVAGVEGPYKIPLQYMAPITRTSSIMTVVTGNINGHTLKFDRRQRWEWDMKGRQVIGQKKGLYWDEIPELGFNCVINDGDLDNKGYPLMIGFQGIYAFYWSTATSIFKPDGNYIKGYQGGKYKEQFPADLTACMAFAPTSSMAKTHAKYYVYLFNKEKYCFRPFVGEKGCKEWRDNRELFGCHSSTAKPKESDGGVAAGAIAPQHAHQEVEAPTAKPGNSVASRVGNLFLLLLTIYLLKHF